MAVLVNQLVPALEHLLPPPQVDLLGESVGIGHLELELRHHAQHPDGNLGRAQELGLALTDVANLARRGNQPHPPNHA